MRFAYVIQRWKVRAWVVLIALAIIGILIAAWVLLYGKPQGPFDRDQLDGLLD